MSYASTPVRRAGLASALLLAGCAHDGTAPDEPTVNGAVILYSTAATPDTLLSGLTIEVRGTGIPSPLLWNAHQPSAAGQSVDTLVIPAGPNRIITATAFIGSIGAYQGKDTVNVSAAGGTVHLVLSKLFGSDTLRASIEDYTVQVDDAVSFVAATTTTSAAAGSTASFTAKVTYATSAADGSYSAGSPVSGATVTWASDNPGVVTVNSGSCTTSAAGTCTVTASVKILTSGQSAGVVAASRGIAQAVTLTVP